MTIWRLRSQVAGPSRCWTLWTLPCPPGPQKWLLWGGGGSLKRLLRWNEALWVGPDPSWLAFWDEDVRTQTRGGKARPLQAQRTVPSQRSLARGLPRSPSNPGRGGGAVAAVASRQGSNLLNGLRIAFPLALSPLSAPALLVLLRSILRLPLASEDKAGDRRGYCSVLGGGLRGWSGNGPLVSRWPLQAPDAGLRDALCNTARRGHWYLYSLWL